MCYLMSFQWVKRYLKALTMICNDHFLMSSVSTERAGTAERKKMAIDGWSFSSFIIVKKEKRREFKDKFWHPCQQCLHYFLAFISNKWPLKFKTSVGALRCGYQDGTHIWHMPILPRVENLRDVVCHYSNQSGSIFQIRTRRLEQIENVLFQSSPICRAIYLGSEGTILKNGGRTLRNTETHKTKGLEGEKHGYTKGESILNNLWFTDYKTTITKSHFPSWHRLVFLLHTRLLHKG